MPQLAPLNWLFLFFLFWFVVGLSSTLIWWFFDTGYKVSVTVDRKGTNSYSGGSLKSWDW
uniref:ATP synthase subunit 8 n=1 Tax=Lunella aff. cinerea STW-2013 TaxID=1425694 RepID=V5NB58_9VEST|nr:ATP synthase subunit 8 [Lunella aff. cinerea STW-2013]